jgi:hypothetical protein
MRPRKRIALLAGIATVCALGALLAVLIDGGSARTARDPAATLSYVAARQMLQANIERSRANQTRAVKAYVAGIASTCAGALRGAPPPIRGKRRFYLRKGSTLVLAPRAILFADATVGVERAMQPAEAAAVSEFTREVRGLRWTDSALTRPVHALADVEDARLQQETPELCRDARAWAASGYKNIAAHTSHTTERLGAAQEALMQALADGGCTGPYPGRAVLHVLIQSTLRGERRTAEALSRLEGRLDARNAEVVQTAVAQIEKVLGSRLLSKNRKGYPVSVVPPCVAVRSTGSSAPSNGGGLLGVARIPRTP